MRIPFASHSRIYTPSEVDSFLSSAIADGNVVTTTKKIQMYNVPCAFDIETSSFYRGKDGSTYTYEQITKLNESEKFEKISVMYVWQLGINGLTMMGRTWDEFISVINYISKKLGLCEDKRLIIYVHNLSYEFQFIRNRFTWNKVFSIDLRKPIYAITNDFIEFRCSYLLSGYSLDKLSDQLQKYRVKKLVGDLDYKLIRHSNTPLTDKEIGYCINDIKVVMCYIQELIEQNKGIHRLPLTKTGFVRKYCRKTCLRTKDANNKSVMNWKYINLIHSLNITGLTEFNMLLRAFAGGFTHANANHADEIKTNVSSYDFTSSYPYAMIAEQYPMSTGVPVEVKSMKQFEYYISKYCCIFDIEFTNIFASEIYENPISVSKCIIKDNVSENNGRLVCASKIVMTITNVDYDIIKNFYTWESVRIGAMYAYKKDYLPTDFVKSIIHLYELKTKLKGVDGKEVEYLNSKEMLNSCYGMCVTNPLRDEFTYEGDWDTEHLSTDKQIETLINYNDSKNRFLFYPWGVFVTAYARKNLFTGIHECKDDYVYSDTDSIKILHADRHTEYFDMYNKLVELKLKKACAYHNIDFDSCAPKTIKGVTKMIGVWDYEGLYTRFKTLGAKRYLVEINNALKVDGITYNQSLTVSGVNKKTAIPYLIEKFGENEIFDKFTNYLSIPPVATGKNIHSYIDYPVSGEVSDYNGNVGEFDELTGVHLEPTGYTLSLSVMYLNYLLGKKFKD